MSEALVLRVRIETQHEGMSTCQVVGITGSEVMNRLYRFEIDLESDVGAPMFLAIDDNVVLLQRIKLTLSQAGVDSYIHGQVMEAHYTGSTRDRRHHYRIAISSGMWCFGNTRRTRVFPDTTVPDVVDQVLSEFSVTATWDKVRTFPQLASVTQYQESDLAFVSRLLENDGVWWCFKHDEPELEKLFICDHSNSHPPEDEAHHLAAAWQDAGAASEQRASITNLTFHEQTDAIELRVRDYNPTNPGVPYGSDQEVDPVSNVGLRGVRMELEQHLFGQDHADNYARLRAHELRSNHRMVRASSNLPSIRVGHSVVVSGHPVNEVNTQYLVIGIDHRWFRGDGSRVSADTSYSNQLVLLPYSRMPFVPRRVTPVPKIPGFILGTVLEGPGKLEGDVAGSYHVRMRLDEDGAQPQRLVRMAEPSTGADYGIHWPLPIGAEVVMAHINGDPDRPVIAGAMPNVELNSPVQEANNTQAVWRGAKGNEVIFEDKDGSEFIRFTAVKDWERHVRAKSTTSVGGDCQTTVSGKKDTAVTKDCSLDVSDGNLTVTVEKNVIIASTGITSMHADHADGAVMTAPKIKLEADNEILLKVGGSTITITPDTITIHATNVHIESTDTTVDGSSGIAMTGGTISATADTTADVTGATTTITGNTTATVQSGSNKYEAASAGSTVAGATVSITGTSTVSISGPAGVGING